MIRSYGAILVVSLICVALAITLYVEKRFEKASQPAPVIQKPLPPLAGTLFAPTIRFRFAVYMLPKSSVDAASVVRSLPAIKNGELRLVKDLPKAPDVPVLKARVENDPQKNFAPPSRAAIESWSRGLSAAQKSSLRSTQQVVIFDFAHPSKDAWTALRRANELVEEVARRFGGIVWDDETGELFTPASWHERRLSHWTSEVPDVTTQFVVELYRSGETGRGNTRGLIKMGLPDAVVEPYAPGSSGDATRLLDTFAQSVAEGVQPRTDHSLRLNVRTLQNAEFRDRQLKKLEKNAYAVACLTLSPAKVQEGDPDNRLTLLSPAGYRGEDPEEQLTTLLNSFLGVADKFRTFDSTPELDQESTKERENFEKLRPAFTKGLPPGEYLEVKAPFSTPSGGTEYMWVQVRKWTGDKITGKLGSSPDAVPGLRAGKTVQIRQQDVFDYLRHIPDGTDEGNTTKAILDKIGQEDRQAAIQVEAPPCGVNAPD